MRCMRHRSRRGRARKSKPPNHAYGAVGYSRLCLLGSTCDPLFLAINSSAPPGVLEPHPGSSFAVPKITGKPLFHIWI
jgi:hypothetical protein